MKNIFYLLRFFKFNYLGEIHMDLIQLKIKKDNSLIKYIKIIRKFDNSLSVNVIKETYLH